MRALTMRRGFGALAVYALTVAGLSTLPTRDAQAQQMRLPHCCHRVANQLQSRARCSTRPNFRNFTIDITDDRAEW